MKAKILVIDPSVTIHKVIGIMLSDGPYELTSCSQQEEYGDLIKQGPYDLVVLDGHFSDNIIGQVKQDLPAAKILAMLGTFDQDNEDELLRQGADACIVRPFESGTFVEQCRQLLAAAQEATANSASAEAPAATSEQGTAEILAAGEDDIAFAEMSLEPAASTTEEHPTAEAESDTTDAAFAELDQMPLESSEHAGEEAVAASPSAEIDDTAEAANATDTAFAQLDNPQDTEDEAFAEMDAPSPEASAEESAEQAAQDEMEAEGTSSSVNLDDTLSGWSVNAPTIQPAAQQAAEPLGDDALAQAVAGWGMSVPDVIGESNHEDFTGEIPGVIGAAESGEAIPAQQDLAYPDEGNKEDSAKILSKLVPIANLEQGEDGEDFEDADRTVSMEIDSDMLGKDGLEEEIAKELSGENFWTPEEEGASGKASASSPAAASTPAAAQVLEHLTPQIISEIKQAFPALDKAAIIEEVKHALPPFDLQQVSGQMQDLIRPELDKLVQEYCQKTIEHVAWEIIPDLAENLIKQHLQSIAEEMKQSSAS